MAVMKCTWHESLHATRHDVLGELQQRQVCCMHAAVDGEGSEQRKARESSKGEVQTRLRSFLKQSSQYDSRLVLARIRGSHLWQEQVVLHSKVSHASPLHWHASKTQVCCNTVL